MRRFAQRIEVSEHWAEESLHRHNDGYAAIVLNGAYLETSADGPVCVSSGDMIIHPPFHQHKNIFQKPQTKVLNIGLSFGSAHEAGYQKICGLSLIELETLLRTDPQRAQEIILNKVLENPKAFVMNRTRLDDAAEELRRDARLTIAEVSKRYGYTHSYFTRAFANRFGSPPAEFRAEHRFRQALQGILHGKQLAQVAISVGYADQAHMTRDFRLRAGATPANLVQQVKFVQDANVTD